MNKDEQILYDFFCQVGIVNNSINYPLILLNIWVNDETSGVAANYEKKDEVIAAYNHCVARSSLDKPLYEAIKQIKGWK